MVEKFWRMLGQFARELAYKEYDKFRIKQDKIYNSDFDKFINQINEK